MIFFISDIEQEQPGGALFVQTMCTANISNCHFSGNQAADDGGAIFIKIASNLIVSNSWFEQNNAQDSGGSIAVVNSSVFISFSHFLSESVSRGLGGSICLLDAGHINVKHSEFKNCSANKGGSLSIMLASKMHIEYSSIEDSISNTSAGALYIYLSGKVIGTYLSLVNCKSKTGGGIHVEHLSSVFMNHTSINGSSAISSHGGGICSTDSEIELHHCSISENRAAGQGGGLYLENGNIFMDYVSFYMNIAVSFGGGLSTVSSYHVTIHNSRGVNNSADQSGGFMYLNRSTLVCKHLKVDNNIPFSSSIITITNSHANINFLHFVSDHSFCPIVARSRSYLEIQGFHGANNTSIMIPRNETMALVGHVCKDNNSIVTGIKKPGTNFSTIN